jgi:glyoxylate reductase
VIRRKAGPFIKGSGGGATKPKVYVTRPIFPHAIELLAQFCEVVVSEAEDPPPREELLRQMRDKDGILCLPETRIDQRLLDAAPRLKAISTMTVGYDHIDVPECTKRGIYVGFTPDVLTDATADLAFALLLCAARRLAEADRFVRAGMWKKPLPVQGFLGTSTSGKTLGIIGFGRIGRAVGIRAKGFQMHVVYYDKERLRREDEETTGAAYRPLEDLLRESDFVSLHVPLSDSTRSLIDEARLRLMKPGAILINTSRGQTVDEGALSRALKESRILAAGLDVYEKEPLDPASPLLALDNVVLLPHLGSAAKETREKMAEMAVRNLLAVFMGEKPPGLVNHEVESVRPLDLVKMI